MKPQRKIRLLMPWGYYSTGQVFTEMPNGQAAELVSRNIAEYCDEAVKAAPLDRMMAKRRQMPREITH